MDIEVIKRDDVAKLLQIHPRTVDHLIFTGQIPYSRIGKRNVRFDKAEVIRWFKSRSGIPFHRNMKGNNGD
jgi:excisionase family DNA binding protein